MAFIWRRRSTSIVKIIAVLTAIWFFVAFFIYTDDTRREDASNKWNAMSQHLKNFAGNNQLNNIERDGGGLFEAGGGFGVANNVVLERNNNADDDADVVAADIPIPQPDNPNNSIANGVEDINQGDESIVNNVVVHPNEKQRYQEKLAGRKKQNRYDQANQAADDGKSVLAAPSPPKDAPGEMGKPVVLPKNMTTEMKKTVDDGWEKNAFNQYASDLISIHRSLPDPRDAWCKEPGRYLQDLPTTDVIICFHNEAWSVLLRTVHSVFDRSPEHLIGRIILVDDFSDMPHTQKQLEDYFAAYPKVKILRAQKREGLIRARLLGARHAISPVLTYLDSHCECTEGWLEPLLDRIARNSTTVVCPVIDVIDDTTLEYHYRDSGGVNVGGFDWNLQFNWHAVPDREKKRHKVSVQRRQRRVLDTSSTYVRGEENLHGWRPRGDSLIFDHQWELEKLTRLEEVGRVRHVLLLRERLGMDTNPNPTTKSEKDVCNLAAKAATSPVHMVMPPSPQTPVKDPQHIMPEREYNEREKELMAKCLKLIQGRCQKSENSDNQTQSDVSPSDEGCADMTVSCISSNSMELCSPDRSDAPNGWEAPAPATQPVLPLRLYVPELEEIRVSPVVARKGILNVLEHGGSGWKKRWVIVRRPYVFIYKSEKDPVERAVLNLGTAQVECSEDQAAMVKIPNTFSVVTKHRGYLLQTLGDKEVHDWLYAINPLLAGQIRSRLARRTQEMASQTASQIQATTAINTGSNNK